MANDLDNITLHHLKSLRTELAALGSQVAAGFKDNAGKIGLLADGLLALRREFETMRHDLESVDRSVQTLTIAAASHGERLADVDERLTQFEVRLGRIEERLDRPH